jgi:hypothetical protein
MASAGPAGWERSTAGRGLPGSDPAWSEMETVWHNTHLVPAIRIGQDRRISGGLIYDGKLRQSRTEVVYVTPKPWGGGSIYGSFCFQMEWVEIAKGRQLYWVEENLAHENPISRFLLSWNDVSALPVTPYDPTRDNGPLRLSGDRWFWLSTTVPEIVIDDVIYTISLSRLTFDLHRDGYCHPTRGFSCRERGHRGSTDAQTSFVARLLGDPAVGLEDLLVSDGSLTPGVYGALSTLYRRLLGKRNWGGPIDDYTLATDTVTSACLAYHLGEPDRAKRLLDMIDSDERAETVFRDLIRRRFAFEAFDWQD